MSGTETLGAMVDDIESAYTEARARCERSLGDLCVARDERGTADTRARELIDRLNNARQQLGPDSPESKRLHLQADAATTHARETASREAQLGSELTLAQVDAAKLRKRLLDARHKERWSGPNAPERPAIPAPTEAEGDLSQKTPAVRHQSAVLAAKA